MTILLITKEEGEGVYHLMHPQHFSESVGMSCYQCSQAPKGFDLDIRIGKNPYLEITKKVKRGLVCHQLTPAEPLGDQPHNRIN